MAKKKKNSKPAEDKREKFKRVVIPRVTKALNAIALIGNQSSSAYSYTENDVEDIITVLRRAVDAVEKRYSSSGKQEVDFSLD